MRGMRVGTKSDAFDREGMKVDEADLRVIKGLRRMETRE